MSRPEAAVDCECCEGGGRYPVYGASGKLHCWITCPACEGARHDYSEARAALSAHENGEGEGALLSVDAIAADRSALLMTLYDAKLQLQYLESRWPTGTTPAVITRIERALNDALPWVEIAQALKPCAPEPQP